MYRNAFRFHCDTNLTIGSVCLLRRRIEKLDLRGGKYLSQSPFLRFWMIWKWVFAQVVVDFSVEVAIEHWMNHKIIAGQQAMIAHDCDRLATAVICSTTGISESAIGSNLFLPIIAETGQRSKMT